MFGDMTANDIELLNAFTMLSPSAQKELKDYLRYLLCKQYKKELMSSIFHNELINSLVHSLLHSIERDEFNVQQIEKRIIQINEIYFAIFEQVYNKYSEVVEDLDSHELVKEFGKNSLENIQRACCLGDRDLVRLEIIDYCESYNKLAKKKDARRIVAV